MGNKENGNFEKCIDVNMMQKILSDKCRIIENDDIYDMYSNLTTEQAMFLINTFKEGISKIKGSLKYVGQYYYTDPMGSTFSNENEWKIICYGNTEEECEKYCETHGYKKSKSVFDGGYEICKNPDYKE